MNPFVAGKVDAPFFTPFRMHGRNEHVPSKQILVSKLVKDWIVLVVHDRMPHRWQTNLLIFFEHVSRVREQSRMDIAEPGKVSYRFFVGIPLPVDRGSEILAAMGSHHGRERGQLAPAHEQFLCPLDPQDVEITTNVRMMVTDTAKSER